MKKAFHFLCLFCLLSCVRSNDDGTTRNLPAITLEGKNTFGCKIDGVTFLPKSTGGFTDGYKFPELSARYFKLDSPYYDYQPGYYLKIIAINEFTNNTIVIELTKSDQPLIEDKSYPIVLKEDGSVSAECSFSTTTPDKVGHHGKTSATYNGELRILKIDKEKLIISGTFSFDCIDNSDNTVAKIRDGRFDIRYEPFME